MADFDSPWKEALDLYFADFLLLLFPEIHAEIDWSRGFEFLDKELMKIMAEAERGRGEVDKLVKVWLPDGKENWLLPHVELQAQEEAGFPLRMFNYNSRILDRYDKEVVSLAVFGDDRLTWRPNQYQTERWGCKTSFEYPFVKLLDFRARTVELEQSVIPIAKVILAHLAALETRKTPADRKDRKSIWSAICTSGGCRSSKSASYFA
jgi:hypothetical protein